MAITFVGSNTGVTSGLNVTVNLPAMVQNDMVLLFSGSPNTTVGPPSTSGYTLVADLVAPGNNQRLYIARKFMGATPDTAISITTGGAQCCALALVFRGVNTTTPLDVAVTSFQTTSSSVPNSPAITPSSNDCCIVAGAVAANNDANVGSITSYLPSPSVQATLSTVTVAAAYRILSGGATVPEDPLAWSTWSVGDHTAASVALRSSGTIELVTVDKATATITGKAIAERELVAISKATISYLGKTIGIPDSSVESIFVDKYRMVIAGQQVNPFDTSRAVTVTPAAVLYRGRIVTPREIQFEDVPRYRVKGRGSGHWMETR